MVRLVCMMQGEHECPETEEDEEQGQEESTDDEDTEDELEREIMEQKMRGGSRRKDAFPQSDKTAEKAAPHLVMNPARVAYEIAIPTHGRWRPVYELTGKQHFQEDTSPFILAHTLRFLSCQGIDKQLVTLFIASPREAKNYRVALQGAEWKDVRIVISVLGNRDNRNFIYNHYKAGSYVISIDDDVEGIVWKCREGDKHRACLRPLPAGGLQKLIFAARMRMKETGAFLWGLSTSQNPRHMNTHGISVKNGLVCGYLNGFICRPECPELLRRLADATEDSEFAVRHFAKDGVVLRYQMYAGVTSPYLNRGGLQQKFEVKGEQITALERSCHRKQEERAGAAELHRLFPRLIGPPRKRRDKKTMEVYFYSAGRPPGERKMISPNLRGEDVIEYRQRNPKKKGTVSHALYQRYKVATTVAQARRLGARPIDFAFDANWGYLKVTALNTDMNASECQLLDSHMPYHAIAPRCNGGDDVVYVRLREMSKGHVGIAIPREMISRLSQRCTNLCGRKDHEFIAQDGPFARIPIEVFRRLLHWAETGRLFFERAKTKEMFLALRTCGAFATATKVRRLGRHMPGACIPPTCTYRSSLHPMQETTIKKIPFVRSKRRRACTRVVHAATSVKRPRV